VEAPVEVCGVGAGATGVVVVPPPEDPDDPPLLPELPADEPPELDPLEP
jgi:hypothetical protein